MAKVAHLLVLVILVIAPGFSHADYEEVGQDEVRPMSPKELDSLIYNTYMMYQKLKYIAKM